MGHLQQRGKNNVLALDATGSSSCEQHQTGAQHFTLTATNAAHILTYMGFKILGLRSNFIPHLLKLFVNKLKV